MDSSHVPTGHVRSVLMKMFVTKFSPLKQSFTSVAQVVLKLKNINSPERCTTPSIPIPKLSERLQCSVDS